MAEEALKHHKKTEIKHERSSQKQYTNISPANTVCSCLSSDSPFFLVRALSVTQSLMLSMQLSIIKVWEGHGH